MAKKHSKKDKEEIIEQNEAESVDEVVSETESVSSESEAAAVEVSQNEDDETESTEADDAVEDVSSEEEVFSPDDLLDDVRRSLIEENERAEKEKKPKWWQKLGVGARKTKDSDEVEEIVEPPVQESLIDMEEDVEDSQEDAGESIDDLIELLETEDDEQSPDVELIPAAAHIEEEQPKTEKVDVEELKKRAFSGSTPADRDENFSDVRAVALEDGEEVFVEVEVKAEDPVEVRIKSFENALRPYRGYINFGIAFIGVIVIVATSVLLYDTYQRSLPPEPTKEPSNLPFPVRLNVPGEISFNLGRGVLDDGSWNPQGAEWLEGTEVCRWVAIPYSRQLEAVVRTLTRDDQLELVMSNSDVVAYDVFSITQMSIENMQNVSENTPCLLLVLADAETDTRWVVTAYP
ncbi:MAG TPA: hypothetical protein VLA72_05665 [Anaerolineales bacterium]|nr:hypothetical protein [Anaerolineales bacterium]